MANVPCLNSTDSAALSLAAVTGGLVVDVRRSQARGNPLVVHDAASGEQGLDATDAYVGDSPGAGVNDASGFLVQPQLPATLGVQIVWGGDAVGQARTPAIRMPGAGGDPLRKATLEWDDSWGSAFNVSLPVADNTNPRIDRILAQWSSAGLLTFGVKPGVATAGATLDNLLGAAVVDANSEQRLADVQVDAGATQIVLASKIRDRRSFLPNVGVPLPGGQLAGFAGVANSPFAGYTLGAGFIDNVQVACLCRLDRDVFSNFLYWSYWQQSVNPMIGSYVFALYDASRRFVLQIPPANFGSTGVANQMFKVRLPINQPQVLRAGIYYVMFGVSALTGSGTVIVPSGFVYNDTRGPNAYYYRAAGATTPPAGSLDAAAIPFADTWSAITNASTAAPAVPAIMIGDV